MTLPFKVLDMLRKPRRWSYFLAGFGTVLCVWVGVLVINRITSSPGSAPTQVPYIDFSSFELANGLRLLTHRDASAPAVAIELWFHTGSKDEKSGKTGLAHLAEHLMFSPASKQNADSLSELDRIGAWDYNGLTDRDRTRFLMTVPRSALNAMLWLLSEQMGHEVERINEQSLEESRRVVQNEIRRNESDAQASLDVLLEQAAFSPDHPYWHAPAGELSDIASISVEDAKVWVKEHYSPSNATLVVAGDVDPPIVHDTVNTYFGYLQGGIQHARSIEWLIRGNSLRHVMIEAPTLEPQFAEVWIVPGYAPAESDYLDLARYILESRLQQSLIYKSELATSVTLDLRTYELCGLLILKVTRSSQTSDSEIAIETQSQIAKLSERGPTDDELRSVKERIISSLLFQCEAIGGPSGKAGLLASSLVLGDDSNHFNRSMVRIQNAVSADIARVVSRWASSEAHTRITIRPRGGPSAMSPATDRPQSMPEILQSSLPVRAPFEHRVLGNGLEVLLIRRASSIAGAKVIWRIPTAARVLQSQMVRLTHRLISDGGSYRLSAFIQNAESKLGSRFVIDSTPAYVGTGLEFPAARWLEGIELLAKVVTNDSFEEARINEEFNLQQKGTIRVDAMSSKQSAFQMERMILRRGTEFLLHDKHEPSPIDSAVVKNFYQRFFGPDKAILIVVGDCDLDLLERVIAPSFGKWAQVRHETEPSESDVAEIEARSICLLDHPGSSYASIVCGRALPHHATSNSCAGKLAAKILDSRIHDGLRIRSQLSYEAYGSYEISARDQIILFFGDSAPENVLKVIGAMAKTLRLVENSGALSFQEIAQARNALLQRMVQSMQTTGQIMDAVADTVVAERSEGYDSCELSGTSDEEVRNAALQFSNPDKYLWVVVGNSALIGPKMERAGYKVRVIPMEDWSRLR